MDRREFLNQAWKMFLGKAVELISETALGKALDEASQEKQRPPGALTPDHLFQEKCTGCDACMIACPVNVIMIDDLVKRHPVIYPETAPCLHCEGYPCIQVCPTQALQLSSC